MSRTLSIGMTGEDVGDLQAALNYHLRPPAPPHTPPSPERSPLQVDSVFGPMTDARLREFQRVNGLDTDGLVGRVTRPLLTKAKQVTVKIPINTEDGPPGSLLDFALRALPSLLPWQGNYGWNFQVRYTI